MPMGLHTHLEISSKIWSQGFQTVEVTCEGPTTSAKY